MHIDTIKIHSVSQNELPKWSGAEQHDVYAGSSNVHPLSKKFPIITNFFKKESKKGIFGEKRL